MDYRYPLHPLVEIEEIEDQLQQIGECRAEAGAGAFSLGFDSADASSYASSLHRDAEAQLAQEHRALVEYFWAVDGPPPELPPSTVDCPF